MHSKCRRLNGEFLFLRHNTFTTESARSSAGATASASIHKEMRNNLRAEIYVIRFYETIYHKASIRYD